MSIPSNWPKIHPGFECSCMECIQERNRLYDDIGDATNDGGEVTLTALQVSYLRYKMGYVRRLVDYENGGITISHESHKLTIGKYTGKVRLFREGWELVRETRIPVDSDASMIEQALQWVETLNERSQK